MSSVVELAVSVSRKILTDAHTPEQQWQVATVTLLGAFGALSHLVKNKKVSKLRAADLLFDLRKAMSDLEAEFGQQ